MVPFRLSRCYSQSGSKILISQIRLPIEQDTELLSNPIEVTLFEKLRF